MSAKKPLMTLLITTLMAPEGPPDDHIKDILDDTSLRPMAPLIAPLLNPLRTPLLTPPELLQLDGQHPGIAAGSDPAGLLWPGGRAE